MTHHTQAKSPREVELKFAVPAASVDAVTRFLTAKAPAAGQVDRKHQVTTYFDTNNRILSGCGMSLRVRCVDGQRIQTLKAKRKAGVAADRAELEWQIDQDTPDLALLAQTPAAEMLPQDTVLEPVLVTDIDRTLYILQLDEDTVVEAALDQGVITAGTTRQLVSELELELQRGDAGPLFRLGLELHATTPLTIESDSKAERGYRLQTGTKPIAHKAHDLSLEPTTTAGHVFSQILNVELGHLLANQPAAVAGDAEGVHQMRIAIRRMRTVLALFQPHLEPHATSRFQAELQRVGRVFGKARDWDVFCLQILPDAMKAEDVTGWSILLQQPAAVCREAAHRRFVHELLATRFTALVLGLAAWVEQESLFARDDLQQPIETLGSSLLDRMAHKLERRGRHIQRLSNTERHALRKSLKKLRYGIDFLRAVFPHKAVKSYLHHCKKLQEALGDINDAVTACALAEHLLEGARPDLVPAVAALTKQLLRRRDSALNGLNEAWETFREADRFWT